MKDSGAPVVAPRILPWLLLLFVGSGCAALIYEVVWLQLLQLVIGLTNVSLGVLLGTYMGGMCLGSLLLPRMVSAQRHPLRVYAALELGIGLIGVLILFIVPAVSQVYTEFVGRGFPGMLLRGGVAALCLLPPTVLMGATLPAMARWIEATREGTSWLGFFYGGNIAGAVFGCLLAGFYLLRVFDMATATCVAAFINLAVALAALAMAFWNPARVAQPSGPDVPDSGLQPRASQLDTSVESTTTAQVPAGPRWVVYLTIALSGMSALGAEVVWTRLLSLILGGTVYTFSIILAVFLMGLGIGSTAGSFLARTIRRPRWSLALCQMLLVGAISWTAYMVARSLPYWPINPAISLSPWYTFQMDLARCLWALLPAAALWGASFPLALAAVASRQQDSGRMVGRVYAANTVGAILGALGFSLLLVPWTGTFGSEKILIGLATVSGLLMGTSLLGKGRGRVPSASDPEPLPGFAGVLLLFVCVGVAGLLMWTVSPAPWGIFAYGRFMATYGDRLAPGIRSERDVPTDGGNPDIYCTYVGEGLNGSVAVTKWTSGARNFHSAGKVQASTEPRDMRLQRMLGHLCGLVHEKPESVLVVACGAGVTAGSFVVHPEVKRIVICDIEPLVPKFVAPMFAKENYDVVHDPRTQVMFDDGRHYIRTTQEKFDVITSDPIDPWVKGCAALNTVEYYQACKQHLKPGGVMALWIPLYESNPQTVKSVLATFFKVFPNGILWSNDSEGEGYDAVLFGQAEPTQIDIDQMQVRLERPDHARVKQSLAEVGFRSAVSLLATYAGQARDLQVWMRDAQINTDANLRLQYLAGLGFNSYMGSEILGQITHYRRFPDGLFVGSEYRKKLLRLRLLGPKALSPQSTSDDTP
jgi:spermidine synthase